MPALASLAAVPGRTYTAATIARMESFARRAARDPRVIFLARRIARSSGSNERSDQARAIFNYGRDSWTYTLDPVLTDLRDVDVPSGDLETVVDPRLFLFESPVGDCASYTAAYMALLRAVGIPAYPKTVAFTAQRDPYGNPQWSHVYAVADLGAPNAPSYAALDGIRRTNAFGWEPSAPFSKVWSGAAASPALSGLGSYPLPPPPLRGVPVVRDYAVRSPDLDGVPGYYATHYDTPTTGKAPIASPGMAPGVEPSSEVRALFDQSFRIMYDARDEGLDPRVPLEFPAVPTGWYKDGYKADGLGSLFYTETPMSYDTYCPGMSGLGADSAVSTIPSGEVPNNAWSFFGNLINKASETYLAREQMRRTPDSSPQISALQRQFEEVKAALAEKVLPPGTTQAGARQTSQILWLVGLGALAFAGFQMMKRRRR